MEFYAALGKARMRPSKDCIWQYARMHPGRIRRMLNDMSSWKPSAALGLSWSLNTYDNLRQIYVRTLGFEAPKVGYFEEAVKNQRKEAGLKLVREVERLNAKRDRLGMKLDLTKSFLDRVGPHRALGYTIPARTVRLFTSGVVVPIKAPRAAGPLIQATPALSETEAVTEAPQPRARPRSRNKRRRRATSASTSCCKAPPSKRGREEVAPGNAEVVVAEAPPPPPPLPPTPPL